MLLALLPLKLLPNYCNTVSTNQSLKVKKPVSPFSKSYISLAYTVRKVENRREWLPFQNQRKHGFLFSFVFLLCSATFRKCVAACFPQKVVSHFLRVFVLLQSLNRNGYSSSKKSFKIGWKPLNSIHSRGREQMRTQDKAS